LFQNVGSEGKLDFHALYAETFPILIRIAYKIVNDSEAAEDLVQEAYIRFCEKGIPFATRDDAKFWLIRVLKNTALNYAKRKGRERKAYERALREVVPSRESGETRLLESESVERVQAALAKLPEKLRTVLVLKEYGDMNYKEIGRVLGISEGNVKVRVFRARERLSAFFKEEETYVP
jgi:RNA polymerase sigma factor (sigma-70 family)